jgi:glucose-6-phosphate dehydrogenase assembly protein OpcA
VHVGAGGEVAHVIIELLGAGVAGKVISDLIDHAKKRIAEWREQFGPGFDQPPDFTRYDPESLDSLLDRLRGELAEIINVPLERIEVSGRRVETRRVAEATFRNAETGDEYEVAIDRSTVTFARKRLEQ